MSNKRFKDKLIIITGASQGIGAATGRLFAQHGAGVVLLARSADKLNALVDEIRLEGGLAEFHPIDLSDPEATRSMGAELVERYGPPDIVFHNAGAGQWKAVDETSAAEAQVMMHVPYFAAFNLTATLLPAMIKRNSGHFIIINSPARFVTWPGSTGYASARHAMVGFAQGLRGDLCGTKLRVTKVVVGETSSNYWDNNPGAQDRMPKITKLVGTMTSEQVAETVLKAACTQRRMVVDPFMLRVVFVLNRLTPSIVEHVVNATGWKR
ncbi:MAG: SDR family NAD(P)-dependent oxidoreductase [Chloroflexota bacterium]